MARLTPGELTPLQPLTKAIFQHKNIQVWLKRDDLNHPLIQGNKLHKLKYNLQKAKQLNCDTLISFGGAYSNHIAALSIAGKEQGFRTLAYIRGDELKNNPKKWSHTLKEAHKYGMEFVFLTRQDYRKKNSDSFLKNLSQQQPNAYIIPEGGTNSLAVKGFKETINHLDIQCPEWTHLFTAVGTGGTLSGLSKYANEKQKIQGVATLKNAGYLEEDIGKLTPKKNWQLLTEYHGGGYAKNNPQILDIQTWFEQNFNVLLDPIYTNKMVFGFMEELRKDNIAENAKVILYHSGGLQGRAPGNF